MAAASRGDAESWEATAEDDEALSLSDLPLLHSDVEPSRAPEADDFEFRTFSGEDEAADACMCAADDVFFQGQILPLRPSVSSDGVFFPASRCGSRSESMDRLSSSAGSLGSESSGSSSRSSSISARSSSCPSEVLPRLPICTSFCAYPSPKPYISSRRKKEIAASPRKSSSSGWELLRLGLVRTPEINLNDLRLRKLSSGHTAADLCKSGNRDGVRPEKKKKAPARERTGGGSNGKDSETRTPSWRSFGRSLRCKCSPDDAIDPRCPAEPGRRSWKAVYSRRTFEWLAALPAAAELAKE